MMLRCTIVALVLLLSASASAQTEAEKERARTLYKEGVAAEKVGDNQLAAFQTVVSHRFLPVWRPCE